MNVGLVAIECPMTSPIEWSVSADLGQGGGCSRVGIPRTGQRGLLRVLTPNNPHFPDRFRLLFDRRYGIAVEAGRLVA